MNTLLDIFKNSLINTGEKAADAMMAQAGKTLADGAENEQSTIEDKINRLQDNATDAVQRVYQKNEEALKRGELGLDPNELKKVANDIEEQARKEIESLQEKFNWESAGNALRDACLSVLDVGIDTILGEALSNWDELKALADPEQTPPKEVHIVPLMQKNLETGYQPSVDVSFHGIHLTKVTFDVALKLLLEGLNLVIQGGCIQAVRLSRLQFSGAVSFAGNVIIDQPVMPLDIPGEIKFEKPWPINVTLAPV